MGRQLERVGGKRKENKKTKIKTHEKQSPYILLTLETLNVIVLPAGKSEKNGKLQQRSGEGTESPTVCVDEKVTSDHMKLPT